MDKVNPVLLIPGHPNGSDLWQPLSEHYQLVFLYPQAEQFAMSLGVAGAVGLQQFVTPDTHEVALNETARLTAAVVNQMSAINERVSTIVGAQAPHALNGQFASWFGGFAMHHFRERMIEISALEALLDKATVAGCVVHEDVSIDTRTLVLFCKENNIPTIHVPHANCHLRPDGGPDIHRESVSDWIAAAGVYMRDWYIANGYPADRIRVTGAPYWDDLYIDDIPDRREARTALGLPRDETRVIAYAGTWTQTTGLRGGWDAEINAGIKAVLELAQAWQAKLIIKVHPHDAQGTDEAYAQVMRAANVGGVVTRMHGNYTLRAADVLIAQGPSNVCIDAAIIGTPSVYLRTEGFDFAHELPYRCEPDGLAEQAEAALGNYGGDLPAWHDFVKTYNDVHPVGGAVGNVVNMVREICP